MGEILHKYGCKSLTNMGEIIWQKMHKYHNDLLQRWIANRVTLQWRCV